MAPFLPFSAFLTREVRRNRCSGDILIIYHEPKVYRAICWLLSNLKFDVAYLNREFGTRRLELHLYLIRYNDIMGRLDDKVRTEFSRSTNVHLLIHCPKVIVVTGAGAGFGRGIVKKLTSEGAKILAVDIHQSNVEHTAAAAPKGSCIAHTNDVTMESSWIDILQAVTQEFGKLDVVVNCAGVVHIAGPSHEVAEDQYELMFK